MSDLIYSDDDNKELAKAEADYFCYIIDHIRNVNIAYDKLFSNLSALPGYSEKETTNILLIVKSQIADHDKSKFSNEEFNGYRRRFNPTPEEKADTSDETAELVQDAFQASWKHHYTNNSHHSRFYVSTDIMDTYEYGLPKRWVVRDTEKEPVDMSIVDICHMICDWEAMSIHFNSDTIEWYLNDAEDERHCMTDSTKNSIREILQVLYNKKLPSEEEIELSYQKK